MTPVRREAKKAFVFLKHVNVFSLQFVFNEIRPSNVVTHSSGVGPSDNLSVYQRGAEVCKERLCNSVRSLNCYAFRPLLRDGQPRDRSSIPCRSQIAETGSEGHPAFCSASLAGEIGRDVKLITSSYSERKNEWSSNSTSASALMNVQGQFYSRFASFHMIEILRA
jgi:hypothetical protein